MRSVSTLFWTTLLVIVADTLAADLPMCSGVGVYLCFDTSKDLCDEYCVKKGSSKDTCQIFDNSLRVECKCKAADTGCLDTTYDPSAIPTCTDFQIYGCNNACTDLCRGLPNTRGDDQGRAAACNAPNGKTKCVCDSLPVCDDAINDPPTTPPAQSPTTGSDAYQESSPRYAIIAASLTMGLANLIF